VCFVILCNYCATMEVLSSDEELIYRIFSTELSTGWRTLIGCLKLQDIFRKRATNYRALLREMTHEDKASYDSTPPCVKLAYEIFFFLHKMTIELTLESLYVCVFV